MQAYGPEKLAPMYHFLDDLIRDHGHILYLWLVYISIPLIVWILSGGLRRRQPRRNSTAQFWIIVIRPPARPSPLPPPLIGSERDAFPDDDGDSFAA